MISTENGDYVQNHDQTIFSNEIVPEAPHSRNKQAKPFQSKEYLERMVDISFKQELPDNFAKDLMDEFKDSESDVKTFFNAVSKNKILKVEQLLKDAPMLALEVNE